MKTGNPLGNEGLHDDREIHQRLIAKAAGEVSTGETEMTDQSGRRHDMTDYPAPRLEMRWRYVSDDDRTDRMPEARMACDYGLVLPVEKTDIRSNVYHEDENEEIGVLSEVFYVFSTTLAVRYGSDPIPGETPYRDGVHAKWDAAKLGGLPVYAMTIDGVSAPASE